MMSIEKSVVYLNSEQSVVTIKIEGREEQVNVYRDGNISICTETSGRNFNFFDGQKSRGNGNPNSSTTLPIDLEMLEKYLELLFESHKVGHEVHHEIHAALERFRKEIGI